MNNINYDDLTFDDMKKIAINYELKYKGEKLRAKSLEDELKNITNALDVYREKYSGVKSYNEINNLIDEYSSKNQKATVIETQRYFTGYLDALKNVIELRIENGYYGSKKRI